MKIGRLQIPFFGINLESLNYISSGSTNVIPRRSVFYENAKMEAFTGGAMHDFVDNSSDGFDTYCGGFNDVNNVVMSNRPNNSIDFYNAYMNKTSTNNKVLAWKIFNQNNSAFDYALPQVSIIGNNLTGFRAIASDDIGIARLEWYLNGSYVGAGEFYTPPTTLSSGIHSVQVRAYDFEGAERGTYSREDINGGVLRTAAFSSASSNFTVSSSLTMMNSNISIDDFSNDTPQADFTKGKAFVFSNMQQYNQNTSLNNDFIIEDNTDLYFSGIVNGAIKDISIINTNDETVTSIENIYSNEYTVMRNLPSGNYTLKINMVSDIQPISYTINMFAVPSLPELVLPKTIGKEKSLSIKNPYSNQLNLIVNGIEYVIMPNKSSTVAFDEGENTLQYYSENASGQSKTIQKVIFCDSIAPIVDIKAAKFNGESLLITGQVSEYVDNLYIDGSRVILSEFPVAGKPVTFDYIMHDSRTTILNIEAVDASENRFTSSINLEW